VSFPFFIAQLARWVGPPTLRTECLIDLLRRVDKEHNLFVRLKSSFLRHFFAKPLYGIGESIILLRE